MTGLCAAVIPGDVKIKNTASSNTSGHTTNPGPKDCFGLALYMVLPLLTNGDDAWTINPPEENTRPWKYDNPHNFYNVIVYPAGADKKWRKVNEMISCTRRKESLIVVATDKVVGVPFLMESKSIHLDGPLTSCFWGKFYWEKSAAVPDLMQDGLCCRSFAWHNDMKKDTYVLRSPSGTSRLPKSLLSTSSFVI